MFVFIFQLHVDEKSKFYKNLDTFQYARSTYDVQQIITATPLSMRAELGKTKMILFVFVVLQPSEDFGGKYLW